MGDRGIPHNMWLRTIVKTGDNGVYLCHEIVINKAKSLMHNLWRLLNNNSMKTKESIDYSNFKSWQSVFHKVYRWELDSFLVSQTLGPRRQNARYSDQFFFVFGHEVFAWSVPYSWHNKICIQYSSIRSLLFFTVLASVISDVFRVLLTIGSLAAGEPFPVVFIPPLTTWFENFTRMVV